MIAYNAQRSIVLIVHSKVFGPHTHYFGQSSPPSLGATCIGVAGCELQRMLEEDGAEKY